MSLVTRSSRFLSSILLFSILALLPRTASSINPHATLEQLSKLEILCYVPGWLPKGFTLRNITLTYDEPGPDEGSVGRFPLYSIEYGNGPTAPPDKFGQWTELAARPSQSNPRGKGSVTAT
jgi:hypothetical protein